MLASVQAQTYQQWELVIVNACDLENDAKQISDAIQGDGRIRQVRLEKNLHISANTNAGIAVARGDFIAFLDYDDILEPSALNEVAAMLAPNPGIDAFYSDEDKLSDGGDLRYYPFFKPAFNEEQFLTSNFVTHFSVMRTTLVRELGGLRVGYEGSQDYDLWLRVYEKTSKIAHIPLMSYHWRIAEGSTAGTVSSKNYASGAGKRSLIEHLKRRGIEAEVGDFPGQASTYQVKYRVPEKAHIIVVANPNHKTPVITKALSRYSFDWIKPSDNWLDQTRLSPDSLVLFLGTNIIKADQNWLDYLIGKALQPGVGLVSAQVRNANNLSRAGYIIQSGNLEPVYGDYRNEIFGYSGLTGVPQPFSAVSLECSAVKAENFLRMSNEAHLDRNNLSTALFLTAHGYRNVYWPTAIVYSEVTPRADYFDVVPVPANYSTLTKTSDPYLNSNLMVRNGSICLS